MKSSKGVNEAFRRMPRDLFLPDEQKPSQGMDVPVRIGFGQTNSQPSTVRQMLEWLEVEPGDKVLDVGSGSGWTTALLSSLVGLDGTVVAVEKVPELFGRTNCQNIGIENAEFHEALDTYGWPALAPYDRILVSAAAEDLPQELVSQLKQHGKMVIPVRSSILEIEKHASGLEINEHVGYVFVTLVG